MEGGSVMCCTWRRLRNELCFLYKIFLFACRIKLRKQIITVIK